MYFSVDYALRCYSTLQAWAYIKSFFSTFPAYLLIVLSMDATRPLRMLRVFRLVRFLYVLQPHGYLEESRELLDAVKATKKKVVVWTLFATLLVVWVGSLMYFIEGPEHGFDNIPIGIYGAIVTMTTGMFGVQVWCV